MQVGRAFGAEVSAIDISPEKFQLARSSGASDTLNAATTDAAKQLCRTGGVHVSLVTSAAKSAYDTAFSCVRRTGTLLVVGLPAENICFPPILMAAEKCASGRLRSVRDKTCGKFPLWLPPVKSVAWRRGLLPGPMRLLIC